MLSLSIHRQMSCVFYVVSFTLISWRYFVAIFSLPFYVFPPGVKSYTPCRQFYTRSIGPTHPRGSHAHCRQLNSEGWSLDSTVLLLELTYVLFVYVCSLGRIKAASFLTESSAANTILRGKYTMKKMPNEHQVD